MTEKLFSLEKCKEHQQAITLGALLLVLLWGYWNSLVYISGFWSSPEYSHGYLVPLFTLVLLWMRKEPLSPADARARWCGLAVLSFGLLMRTAGSYMNFQLIDSLSFLPSLVGVVLMVTGFSALRWAGPPLAFLIFMFPLPNFLHRALLAPLQHLATVASTYSLQTLGVEAFYEGNRIHLDKVELGVVDACSGLRMLTIFLALAVAITMVTTRPWWERLLIAASAIPIALTVNTIRITVTGLLHLYVGSEIADKVFHDLAGWVMMPMALGFLYLEVHLLSLLFIEEEEAGMPFAFAPQAAPLRPQQPVGKP